MIRKTVSLDLTGQLRAARRIELEDALALLQRALSLHPDEEAQARVWRAIGKANARTARGLEWHTNQSRKLLAKRPEAPRS